MLFFKSGEDAPVVFHFPKKAFNQVGDFGGLSLLPLASFVVGSGRRFSDYGMGLGAFFTGIRQQNPRCHQHNPHQMECI